MVEELSNFTKQVLGADKYILLDFYADWCAPCKAMVPALEAVSEKFSDKLIIYKVNIDNVNHQSLSSDNQIRAVPTLIIFKGGEELHRKAGAQTRQQLEAWLESIMQDNAA